MWYILDISRGCFYGVKMSVVVSIGGFFQKRLLFGFCFFKIFIFGYFCESFLIYNDFGFLVLIFDI